MTSRPIELPEDRACPRGAIWVCAACGKTAEDRYGIVGEHSRDWDESCMLNAIRADEASLTRGADGRVTAAQAWQEGNQDGSS